MKSLFSFRLAVLLVALLVLLTGCSQPETPTEPSADTTPTVDASAQLIAVNEAVAAELMDTDHPVLLHLAHSDSAAEVFAAHVGAAGVLSADAVGFSCRDLPEQTLRILTSHTCTVYSYNGIVKTCYLFGNTI